MRNITIVGAGQAGVQLALGLQAHGYAVRLVTDRTPEQVRSGSILSTQCMFGAALDTERALGLPLWPDCPPVQGARMHVANGGPVPALEFGARLGLPAQSVDQRLKLPSLMELFARRGGRLELCRAGVDDMEAWARDSELVVVAAGKGAIGALFERDAERSPFTAPQRVLAAACVHGYAAERQWQGVSASLIPGAGEYFVMPGLTLSGPCHFMIMEAIPGGPLDRWDDIGSADEHVARLGELLARWLPWEAERAQQMRPADAQATLRGSYAPVVRKPVAVLPSGALALGLADTVVLNDPITGQGANNAACAAAVYLDRILEHGRQPFDAAWMQATFDEYWAYAQFATGWTNAMLLPPPPHVLEIMAAAAELPAVARRFVAGFENPVSLFPWIADPQAAAEMLAAEREADLEPVPAA